MARYLSIDEIKKANKDTGHYFFEKDTMRFFDSRVQNEVFVGPRGAFFVTSERFHGSQGFRGPRLFTVRRFDPATGDVSTVEDFQGYKSRMGAVNAAKRLAKAVPAEEWEAWEAGEKAEEKAREDERNQRQRLWLEHLVDVYRSEGDAARLEHAETVLKMHREDYPNL